MTNTLTSDGSATLGQIISSAEVGADIVRVSCPDEEAIEGVSCNVKSPVPIVADIHFHYKRAIESAS